MYVILEACIMNLSLDYNTEHRTPTRVRSSILIYKRLYVNISYAEHRPWQLLPARVGPVVDEIFHFLPLGSGFVPFGMYWWFECFEAFWIRLGSPTQHYNIENRTPTRVQSFILISKRLYAFWKVRRTEALIIILKTGHPSPEFHLIL
jgi:hypothetical protein